MILHTFIEIVRRNNKLIFKALRLIETELKKCERRIIVRKRHIPTAKAFILHTGII